jgi:hypothetical protein
MLTRPGSRYARDNATLENPGFMEEAGRIARLAAFYGPTAFGR